MTEQTHTHRPKFTSRIIPASETAEKMRNACNRFLESLTPEQRRKSNFDFGSTQRQRWHYLPQEMFDRQGLCLKQMAPNQRKAAFALLATGLSQMGYDKARAIIHLETTPIIFIRSGTIWKTISAWIFLICITNRDISN